MPMERDFSTTEISRILPASPDIESEKSGLVDVISLLSSDVGVPTDLSHLYLNMGGEAWANLGYWKDASCYSDACKALARQIGKLGELRSDSVVLDLGFGCGEQFRIWEKDYGVPIRNITGINVSRSQFQFTKARYSKQEDRPELILGGMEKLTEIPSGSFDRVVALDSFYFFPRRESVVAEIYRILKPGGIFASAEIFLSDRKLGLWEDWKRSLIATMSRMPKSARTSPEKIIASYSAQGFLFEVLDRIDPYIFLGFSEFLHSKVKESDSILPGSLKTRYKLLADYLGSESIKRHFEYWIYKVRKPK